MSRAKTRTKPLNYPNPLSVPSDCEERFWTHTRRDGDCIVWSGRLRRDHGVFWLGGQWRQAHRIAWILRNGEIPDGKLVIHHCANVLCVNPEHLWLGTQQDNMAEKCRKGRARGGTVGNAGPRLNPELVLFLRTQKKSGATTAALAKSVGMRWQDMWLVLTGRSWKNVPMP